MHNDCQTIEKCQENRLKGAEFVREGVHFFVTPCNSPVLRGFPFTVHSTFIVESPVGESLASRCTFCPSMVSIFFKFLVSVG